ncbi:RusA family crossover junction endodeoxyribonuclease [Acidithiobacillus sp.]|uniref:RusA family crossover junction endodeoxyribonuclease n=1 Tax=Acidithiobacillus sp. TaxID=1872118 RepID=UPI003D018710
MIIDEAAKNCTITLPYPISTNRYWRTYRGRTVVSAEARAYKAIVCAVARSNGVGAPTIAPVALSLILCPVRPKDWHKRQIADPNGLTVRCLDIDNAIKVVLDALQGVAYMDDNQVMDLHIRRGFPVDGGALVIHWTEAFA